MKKMLLQIILFVGIFFLRLEGAMYQESDLFEFSENEVVVPLGLGNLKLYKDNEGFHILKDGRICDIQNCYSKGLNDFSNEQLAGFLGRNNPKVIIMTPEEFNKLDYTVIHEITGAEKERLLSQLFEGYIEVHQKGNGEYALEAKLRLLGGGNGGGMFVVGFLVGAAVVGIVWVVVWLVNKPKEKHDEENPGTNKQDVLPEVVKGGRSGTYKPEGEPVSREARRCWGCCDKANSIDGLEKKRREELGL